MPRRGRDFEQTISRILHALHPETQVTTPRMVYDHDSGKCREVDVEIRRLVRGKERLVIVECRDRLIQQDITWIEQLDSKRRGMHADSAIAVSSSPFTSGAISKADAVGIELRLCKSMSAEDVAKVIGDLTPETTSRNSRLHGCEVLFKNEDLAEDADRIWEELGKVGDALRLIDKNNEARQSIHDAWREIAKIHPIFNEVPKNGDVVRKQAPSYWPNPATGYCIEACGRRIDVHGIVFNVNCWFTVHEQRFERSHEFARIQCGITARALAFMFETDMRIDGKHARFTLVVDATKHVKGFYVSPITKPSR